MQRDELQLMGTGVGPAELQLEAAKGSHLVLSHCFPSLVLMSAVRPVVSSAPLLTCALPCMGCCRWKQNTQQATSSCRPGHIVHGA